MKKRPTFNSKGYKEQLPEELQIEQLPEEGRKALDLILRQQDKLKSSEFLDNLEEKEGKGMEWALEIANRYNLWTFLLFISIASGIRQFAPKDLFTGTHLEGAQVKMTNDQKRFIPKNYPSDNKSYNFYNIAQYNKYIEKKQPEICPELFKEKKGKNAKKHNNYHPKGFFGRRKEVLPLKYFTQARIANESGGNPLKLGDENDLGLLQFIPKTAHKKLFGLKTYTNSSNWEDTMAVYKLIKETQEKYKFDNKKVFNALVYGKTPDGKDHPSDQRLHPLLAIDASIKHACRDFKKGLIKYNGNREKAIDYAIVRYSTTNFKTQHAKEYPKNFIKKWKKFNKYMKAGRAKKFPKPLEKVQLIKKPVKPSFKERHKRRGWKATAKEIKNSAKKGAQKILKKTKELLRGILFK